MDDPEAPRRELDEALRFIRGVNRRLAGAKALIEPLKLWSARWPKDRPITMLDVGTGSADIPVRVVRWAHENGHDLRVTATDNHPTTLDLAREHVASAFASEQHLAERITFHLGDAMTLVDDFGPSSFDYVHAGMFIHHLPDLEVLTMLRIMERVARRGIIWNDLVRSRTALAAITVLTAPTPKHLKFDARVSVRKGFTRSEVTDIARRLELDYCRYRRYPLAFRFTLAGELPDAWIDRPTSAASAT